jgi:hypothetical protein
MMTPLLRTALKGAAAGGAGTTALNAATYVDMTLRARPASSTPQQTVDRISKATGVDIPGAEDERENRLGGLGPLLGIAAGVGAGVTLAASRAAIHRGGVAATIVAATALAMLAGNAPMTLAGVTDPRKWSMSAWVADLVPHVAYGLVAGTTLCALDDTR